MSLIFIFIFIFFPSEKKEMQVEIGWSLFGVGWSLVGGVFFVVCLFVCFYLICR